ncbi:MAG: secondary thiamine-phosphate synthase enzyme YjbQ [Desulfohalobiaceae bacterium]
MQELQVKSRKREEMLDITRQIEGLAREQGWQEGVLFLFCTHTTAALTINEAADPTVAEDILRSLQKLVPRQGEYRHMEGNSDAHIKSSLLGCSLQVPISRGRLALGTWQGVFFAEFDGPRSRRVLVQLLADR